MSKLLDVMDKFFWTTFKIGCWIFLFVMGLVIGDYVSDKYL